MVEQAPQEFKEVVVDRGSEAFRVQLQALELMAA